jgi:predicted transcriptional regulator
MVTKRSQLEIYLDILKVINKGIRKPSRIMYGSNLSWNPLKKALESMIKQGFIEKEDIKNRSEYHITSKGNEVFGYWKEAISMLKIK